MAGQDLMVKISSAMRSKMVRTMADRPKDGGVLAWPRTWSMVLPGGDAEGSVLWVLPRLQNAEWM